MLLFSSTIIKIIFFTLAVTGIAFPSFALQNTNTREKAGIAMNDNSTIPHLELATFGAGCFWCVEAVFQDVKGVISVVSGYSGGAKENPTYEEVCSGTTGHAEAVQITFDPSVITYPELLEIFWKTHDPTTPNRQGNDVGTQYRSVIFYHNEAQKQ